MEFFLEVKNLRLPFANYFDLSEKENRFIIELMSEKKSPIVDRLPPLNAMRVFEVAARHLSFVRAAQELCVTHGAVSRQIKQLEVALEFDLFDRRNRAVFLTVKGEVLFEACVEALNTLRQAIEKLKTASISTPLVLSCEPTIAIRWLVPRLPDFRAKFPAHQIHLLTAGGKVDFVRDRVDLALRRNDFSPGTDAYVESVASEMVGPVCAASLSVQPSAKNAAQVKQRLLHSRSRPNAWDLWKKRAGLSIKSGSNEHFEHFYLSLQAASAGLGIAIGSFYMVETDIADGRLIAPFGFIADGSEYVLISPVRFDSDPRRLVFLDWIRKEMGKTRLAAES